MKKSKQKVTPKKLSQKEMLELAILRLEGRQEVRKNCLLSERVYAAAGIYQQEVAQYIKQYGLTSEDLATKGELANYARQTIRKRVCVSPELAALYVGRGLGSLLPESQRQLVYAIPNGYQKGPFSSRSETRALSRGVYSDRGSKRHYLSNILESRTPC